MAKTVGVNIQTIRYYERLKLLHPTARRPSGYRLYGEKEIRRLRFIKNAQALGFSLREIRDLLNLRVPSATQCRMVLRKTQAKLTQVERELAALQAQAESLRDLIRTCGTRPPLNTCPIIESLETSSVADIGH
jgi:MerR family mercuric resistance operon transcriptional regulator/MerR family gold-responsive transcriptional activator of gol and ges genes